MTAGGATSPGTSSGTAPAFVEPAASVRWGMGDAFAGLLLSLLLSLLVSSLVLRLVGEQDFGDLPLWTTALLQVPLWVALLGVPLVATRLKGRRRAQRPLPKASQSIRVQPMRNVRQQLLN